MRRILALLLCCIVLPAWAQTCDDYAAMGEEIATLRDSDPAAGVARGEAALTSASALRPPCPAGRAMLLAGTAANLHILGRHADARARLTQALAALDGGGTPAQRAFIHRGLGVVLTDSEEYPRALRHHLAALAISDRAGESVESAKTAGNLGNLYVTLGDLDKARDYHGRSLRGFGDAGFSPGVAGALVNLGVVASRLGKAAEAAGDTAAARREYGALRDLNRRALGLFEELGNPRGVAYAASNIGLAFDRLGQPLQALAQHQRSLALRREVGDVFGTINSLLSIAATATELERYGEAAAALDAVAPLVPQENLFLLRDVALQRVLLAEARGQLADALAQQREVTRIGGLIVDAGQASAIAALQDRFDAEQSAREMDLLRTQAEVGEARLQRQGQVTQLSLLAAALAIAILVLLLNWLRLGRRSARQLAVAARSDHLTGLPNRRHLTELMEHEVDRVVRGGPAFCLLMVDIDDFKAINDRHGHDAGDRLLVQVGRRLRDGVRRQDTVARWGGEEFLLLLPDSQLAGAHTLADKLRARIAGTPFVLLDDAAQDEAVTMTVTVGIGRFEAGMRLDDCIKAADAALYEGKRQGKDRAVAWPAAPAREPVPDAPAAP